MSFDTIFPTENGITRILGYTYSPMGYVYTPPHTQTATRKRDSQGTMDRHRFGAPGYKTCDAGLDTISTLIIHVPVDAWEKSFGTISRRIS